MVAVDRTGHVLGAATRLSGTDEPTVEDYAGVEMVIQAPSDLLGNTLEATIDAAKLSAKVVTFDEEAFREPLRYVLAEGAVALSAGKVDNVTLKALGNERTLTISLCAEVDASVEVFARAEGADRTFEVATVAEVKGKTAELSLKLGAPMLAGETYAMFVAVAGHEIYFQDKVLVA